MNQGLTDENTNEGGEKNGGMENHSAHTHMNLPACLPLPVRSSFGNDNETANCRRRKKRVQQSLLPFESTFAIFSLLVLSQRKISPFFFPPSLVSPIQFRLLLFHSLTYRVNLFSRVESLSENYYLTIRLTDKAEFSSQEKEKVR